MFGRAGRFRTWAGTYGATAPEVTTALAKQAHGVAVVEGRLQGSGEQMYATVGEGRIVAYDAGIDGRQPAVETVVAGKIVSAIGGHWGAQ